MEEFNGSHLGSTKIRMLGHSVSKQGIENPLRCDLRSILLVLQFKGETTIKEDYTKIAKGMDAEGIRVEKQHEMEKALKKAQRLNQDGKTVLIDVIANIESRRSKY